MTHHTPMDDIITLPSDPDGRESNGAEKIETDTTTPVREETRGKVADTVAQSGLEGSGSSNTTGPTPENVPYFKDRKWAATVERETRERLQIRGGSYDLAHSTDNGDFGVEPGPASIDDHTTVTALNGSTYVDTSDSEFAIARRPERTIAHKPGSAMSKIVKNYALTPKEQLALGQIVDRFNANLGKLRQFMDDGMDPSEILTIYEMRDVVAIKTSDDPHDISKEKIRERATLEQLQRLMQAYGLQQFEYPDRKALEELVEIAISSDGSGSKYILSALIEDLIAVADHCDTIEGGLRAIRERRGNWYNASKSKGRIRDEDPQFEIFEPRE